MQHSRHATRRGLMTRLAILPAMIAAPAVAAARGLSPLWIEWERIFNANPATMTDEEADSDYDRLVVLEAAILRGPIVTRADAAAKARMMVYAMEVGERGDGLDAASAVQLAEWLERP